MADPRAVNDRTGEYIELFNAGDAVVDLAGWRIEDLGTNKHTIGAELPISPGQYLVLGRSGTLTETGGVAVDYVYSSFDLANGDDEIYLLAPDGMTIDSVAWVTTIVADRGRHQLGTVRLHDVQLVGRSLLALARFGRRLGQPGFRLRRLAPHAHHCTVPDRSVDSNARAHVHIAGSHAHQYAADTCTYADTD